MLPIASPDADVTKQKLDRNDAVFRPA